MYTYIYTKHDIPFQQDVRKCYNSSDDSKQFALVDLCFKVAAL